MIEIVEISPVNEGRVAERLAASIRAAWPDLASSREDRVTIVLGIRVLRDIDLLVFVELAKPRPLSALRRRDGTMSPPADVQAAALIVEVKQLDAARFTVQGTQIFPDYDEHHRRSVNQQIDDCVVALRHYKRRYDLAEFFVHGVGWLTAVPSESLAGVNPWIVGQDAGWLGLLDAAAQQSPTLYGAKEPAYVRAIATIRETLVRKRVLSPRDRTKADSLCHDALAGDFVEILARLAGTKQIRLTGRGGSGKTTTLALLAKRLASIEGERVLILTYHRALCGDIAHLIDTLVDVGGIRPRIVVETALTFLGDVLETLGLPFPKRDGEPDYEALPDLLARARAQLVDDPELAAVVREGVDNFNYEHVLIDEAQDWSDAERDLVRALYGSEKLVLADGLEQLVRRQTPCDWNAGVARSARHHEHLGRSLRMASNVAAFANTFAQEIGLREWFVKPVEALPGGRVVIMVGEGLPVAELFASVRDQLAAGGAAPVDALICVPPAMVRVTADGGRESVCGAELRAAGAQVWDACDPRVRDEPPRHPDTWRIVQYDSCRGLEGWVTVAYGLDQLVANKRKHPNLAPGETDSPESVTRRWLMIALTRAVHTLIITISDPQDPLVETLRAVTVALPSGLIEWAPKVNGVENIAAARARNNYGAA